jgi:DNA-binding helix-hairpin-helix protein with protein kinase domain
MSPDEVEPQTVALWTAEIDRRAREVADGKVVLVDADDVHAEAARRLHARAVGEGSLSP